MQNGIVHLVVFEYILKIGQEHTLRKSVGIPEAQNLLQVFHRP